MREVSGTGRQALGDMRRMLGVLRDGTRSSSDAAPLSPQPGLGELIALIDRVRATGLTVLVEESGQRFALSEAAELTVYRIVQEALTNALKHASDPRSVVVTISYDDPQVSVQVTDDGTGANGAANGTGVDTASLGWPSAPLPSAARCGRGLAKTEGGRWRPRSRLQGTGAR